MCINLCLFLSLGFYERSVGVIPAENKSLSYRAAGFNLVFERMKTYLIGYCYRKIKMVLMVLKVFQSLSVCRLHPQVDQCPIIPTAGCNHCTFEPNSCYLTWLRRQQLASQSDCSGLPRGGEDHLWL